MKPIGDHWRNDMRCYASQWGFRCGSGIANLIGYIRDEYRAKYGCDYRLHRTGKNKFIAVPGDHSSYGVDYVVAHADRFKCQVTKK